MEGNCSQLTVFLRLFFNTVTKRSKKRTLGMGLDSTRIAHMLATLGMLTCACASDSSKANSDAGSLSPPAECTLSEYAQAGPYSEGPYGTEVGDTIEDFVLENCDGEEVRLSDILAQSELVLFNIGAGWCEPCIEESETLDSEIFRAFCGRGLQVVQVLFQDEQSRPATKFFCDQWRNRFGLSFPVLVDPTFQTSVYFDSVLAQTPQNFLVSSSGEILFKETGTPAADLPERIRELLPQ